MTALEELAQAVLDGRVHFESQNTWANGERDGHSGYYFVDPAVPVPTRQPISILFDGPPGPVCGRFVEVELDDGRSINAGEWTKRPDGMWALRITELPVVDEIFLGTRAALDRLTIRAATEES